MPAAAGPGSPATAAASPVDAALLARMAEQLDELAAETRRSRERWEVLD
jgi:hypothetical protein